jgi:hypothetical protein
MAGVEALMSHARLAAGLAAAVIVLGLAGVAPARAEFFGCNDRPGQVLYRSGVHTSTTRTARYDGRDYSVQPRRYRHVTYSSAARYYDSHYR